MTNAFRHEIDPIFNRLFELLMKKNSMYYENSFIRNHSKNESYLSKFIKDLTIPFEYKIKGFQIKKQNLFLMIFKLLLIHIVIVTNRH